MSALTNPRGSVHCKSIFLADRRNLRHQLFCSQGACRAESKRQAQRRWLSKDGNRGYFQGSAAVERVRAWRAGHPGYSRRKGKRSPVALQDDCETQVTEEKGLRKISLEMRYKISAEFKRLCWLDLSPRPWGRRYKRTSCNTWPVW